jgi:hypothetical protein
MPRDVEAEVGRWRERLRERREAARNQSAVQPDEQPAKRKRWWRRRP